MLHIMFETFHPGFSNVVLGTQWIELRQWNKINFQQRQPWKIQILITNIMFNNLMFTKQDYDAHVHASCSSL